MGLFLFAGVSLIVTALTAMTASAQTTTEERWEGYRRMNSPEVRALDLPFQQFAENNVFQMISVDTAGPNERYEIVDIQQVPKETYSAVLEDTQNPRALQIETCRAQGLRYCPVFDRANRSTTFVNRNVFHACRHSFHNWISLASQLNGNISVDRISPPMILRAVRNNRMTNLYNSATATSSSDMMRLSFINTNERLNHQTHEGRLPNETLAHAVQDSDYVEMQLGRRLSTSPALAERSGGLEALRADEEVYLVGYPVRTNTFGGPGDSPGNTLMISNGRALAPTPRLAALRTTNYSSGGISGGAMVTATGEIVGMACSGKDDSVPGNVTTSAYPLDRALITRYWNFIPYPSDAELPAAVQNTGVEQ